MSKRIARVRRIEAKRPRVRVEMMPAEVDDPAAREHAVSFLMTLLDRLERGEA
jgi:hypothetical protein